MGRVLAIAIFVAAWTAPMPMTAPQSQVTPPTRSPVIPEMCRLIQPGMTEEDVVHMLGRRPDGRSFSYVMLAGADGGRVCDGGRPVEVWIGDAGRLAVTFGRVSQSDAVVSRVEWMPADNAESR